MIDFQTTHEDDRLYVRPKARVRAQDWMLAFAYFVIAASSASLIVFGIAAAFKMTEH